MLGLEARAFPLDPGDGVAERLGAVDRARQRRARSAGPEPLGLVARERGVRAAGEADGEEEDPEGFQRLNSGSRRRVGFFGFTITSPRAY